MQPSSSFNNPIGPRQDSTIPPAKRDSKGKGKIGPPEVAKRKIPGARELGPGEITQKVIKAGPDEHPSVTRAGKKIGPRPTPPPKPPHLKPSAQRLPAKPAHLRSAVRLSPPDLSASSSESLSEGSPVAASSSSSAQNPSVRREIQNLMKNWSEFVSKGAEPKLFIDVNKTINCGRPEYLLKEHITHPDKIKEHILSMKPPLSQDERKLLIPILEGSLKVSLTLSHQITDCMNQWDAIASQLRQPMLYLTRIGTLQCCSTGEARNLDMSKIASANQFRIAKYLVDMKVTDQDRKELQPFTEYIKNDKEGIILEIDSNKNANVWYLDGKKVVNGENQYLGVIRTLRYYE